MRDDNAEDPSPAAEHGVVILVQEDPRPVNMRGYAASEPVTPLSSSASVCLMTPEMAERFPTPESLKGAPLMHDESIDFLDPPCDWPVWFRAVGLDHAPAISARFSQADHAVDAALAGVGVALGRRALVVKDLHEGRLVAPYGVAVETQAQFRFLCAAGSENRPQIRAFREWMLREIAKTASVTAALRVIPVEAIA